MRVPSWVPISTVVVGSVGAVYFIYRAVAAWRGWPPPRIELGNLSEAVGAAATFAAVVVALIIASRDRRERMRERHDEELTRARLVRLSVTHMHHPAASINVEVRNYGPHPILDVELVGAEWSQHPDAKWEGTQAGRSGGPASRVLRRPLILPSRSSERSYSTAAEFYVTFKDASGASDLAEIVARTAGYGMPSYHPIDLSNVVVRVRFTTADGVRWETPTFGDGAGEPVRLGGSAEQ